MIQVNRSRLSIVRMASEGAAIFFGCGFIAFAATMTEHWVIIHFPPDYFPPYSWIENVVRAMRFVLLIAGISLIFFVRRQTGSMLRSAFRSAWILPAAATIVAIILALVAAEFILRSSGWQSVVSGDMRREPLRIRDRTLGWVLKPSHTGYLVTGGRRIQYANNVFGYREADQNIVPDFARPTIVLAGESVMGGFGLKWDETVSARVARLTNTQTVDLSVGGYSTDQIYLRLKSELPRFQRPVAVVILFSPMLFRRNLEDGRPHLGPDLLPRPAVDRPELVNIVRWAIPYRSVAKTDRAILTTRAILISAVRFAKSRGAIPIVLVPQFVPESAAERLIRSRVLENVDLPVVSVPLDGNWRLPGDWHPDACAASAVATAIVRYLHAEVKWMPRVDSNHD